MTEEDIALVASKWTGIPVTRLTQSETDKILHMEEHLHERIIGQNDAVKVISQAIRRNRTGLGNPHRPIGGFLFLGPTGVGKTTITQLISRFYDPVDGSVLVDGQDVRDVTLESLRKNISPVLQDTFLFNGTIAENIGYAKPDATMEEIQEAAKAANIHEDILSMPEQYETKVGERGLRLSGGQKQRLCQSSGMEL